MAKTIHPLSETLFRKIADLIERSRERVAVTANTAMVYTYFEIGRMIIDEEQHGENRAEYGKKVLNELSFRLIERFGQGFSARNLRNMRQFFLVYSTAVNAPKSTLPEAGKGKLVPRKMTSFEPEKIWQTPSAKSPEFTLSWSHYLVLMRIDNPDERRFYEIEALQQNWSEPQLTRQYHSSLYERLALSRDKRAVMNLAKKGQTVERPHDLLKNPLVLEFLGIDEQAAYSESDLEQANIYASEYNLYLPEKALLKRKLAEWTEEFENAKEPPHAR